VRIASRTPPSENYERHESHRGAIVNLGEYAEMFRRRWLAMAVIALTVLALTSAATLAMPERYTATTRLIFSAAGKSVSDLSDASQLAEKQMLSFAEVATSPLVLEPVIEELGLTATTGELAESVHATVPYGTVILDIAVTDSNPRLAAETANAVGAELAPVARKLSLEQRNGAQPVLVTTFAVAQVPVDPSSPKFLRNLGLAIVLGLILEIALVLVPHLLDTRIRSGRASSS
jgi:capsular polysaccharide biosynthesis protein